MILSKIDFLTMAKNFVGEPFFFQKIPFIENFLWIGRRYHDFLWNFFCLRVPKQLLGGPFFSEKFWIKKLHKKVYHDFVENWFSHSTAKFCRGTLRFSEIFFYRKLFMARRGISRLSLETFLSHSTERTPRRTLFSENFWNKEIA